MLRIREFLDKLILQDPDESNLAQPQKISLLGFLERQFGHHAVSKDESERKFTFNVVYKKSPNNRFGHSEPNNITEERLFEVKTFALTWDGELAIAIIMHDITQQQTILGLQMADAQKDMVLATVSHELRTPLNGIMGIIQIMQKSEHDKRTLENLEICKSSGDLLMGLVNSILDLNLIRSNKIRMNPNNISLYDLLKDIVHMFEFQCQQKGIYIKLEISKTCPEFIFTDRNRLSQIFINLVGNALKFTFEGGITISAHEGEQETVKFFVKDTGIGIKDTEELKLFHMFGPIENDRARANQNGVGFGLTISNGLIKLLNGDANSSNKQYIKAQSVYGAGSSFEFSIKKSLENDLETENIGEISREFGSLEEIGHHIDKIERHPTIPVNNFSVLKLPHIPSSIDFTENSLRRATMKKASSFNPTTTRNKRPTILGNYPSSKDGYVLLVDDNPFNLVVAEKLISSHGYKVKTALSGQLALKSVLDNTGTFEAIRLIFMDIQMPVMDGYETTRQLKSLMQNGRVEEVPIVALTANDSIADKEKCIKAGMSGHLSKPLKDQDLKVILNRYL